MAEKSKIQISIEEATPMPLIGDKPDTRFGITCTPGSVEQYGSLLCDGPNAPSTIYSSARQTLSVMSSELQKIDDASRAVRQPRPGATQEIDGAGAPRWPVAADLHDQFVEGLQSSLNRSGSVLDAQRARVVESLGMLDRSIVNAVTDNRRNETSVAAQGVEIRAHLKNLKSNDRMGEVAAWIKDKDLRSVAAVLDVNPSLWGGTREQQNALLKMAEASFGGDTFKQREAGRAVLAALDAAAKAFVAKWESYLPKSRANDGGGNVVTHQLEALRTGKAA